MASKTTLNARNLEQLGAGRLAELLIEVSAGNAGAKRKLRLELAGAKSPKEAERTIAKRLTSIANARSRIGRKTSKAFVDDLDTQRRGIVDRVAPQDPASALMLMWRFMTLANPVIERCRGSDDVVIMVFRAACADLGGLVAAARPDRGALVESVFDALSDNRFGQYSGLIARLGPALGPEGLEQLRQRFDARLKEQEAAEAAVDRSGPPTPAQDLPGIEARRQQSIARRALLDLADAQGDVDAYIAHVPPAMRRRPATAIAIARRLVAAGRAARALRVLDDAQPAEHDPDRRAWQDARLEGLEALGRHEAAQAFRWACFERDLSADHLRAYLARLPDFDDIEAEDLAMGVVMGERDLGAALRFLLDWRSPARAAELLVRRQPEIDGNAWAILSPAADALAAGHPLAATLALRAMIDTTLCEGRSNRYRHAARHLATCAGLADRVADFGAFEPHDAYLARLRRDHGRKPGFWSLVDG